MLAVLFLARTALAIQFGTVGSVGPVLVDAYAIDFTWLGTLIGLYMLPGVFVAIPSGLIAQTFGAKRVALIGLVLMIGGGVLTASESFALALAGRLISGIGGVILNVLITKMVADWFAENELVLAMSIVVSSWPLGIGLGLVVFPIAAAFSSWKLAMLLAAAFALISLVLLIAVYRESANAAGARAMRISLTQREWRLIIAAGAVWGFYNAAYIIYISFLPDLLTGRGWSLAEAGRAVSLLALVPILSVPLSGLFAQHVGRPNLLLAIGLGGTAIAGFLAGSVSNVASLLVGMAILGGIPAGLTMSLASEALSAENRAVGMGAFFTCFYLTMALLPAAAGRIRDFTGEPTAPLIFGSVLMMIALLCVGLFRLAQRGTDKPASA